MMIPPAPVFSMRFCWMMADASCARISMPMPVTPEIRLPTNWHPSRVGLVVARNGASSRTPSPATVPAARVVLGFRQRMSFSEIRVAPTPQTMP